MHETAPIFEVHTGGQPDIGSNAIEQGVIDLYKSLEEENLLGIVEIAKKPILLKAARSLDRGLENPKITVATANIAKQFFEALDGLPKPEAKGNPEIDALHETINALTTEALLPQEDEDASEIFY